MTAPPHAKEHHELLQLVGKLVQDSKLIDGMILITVGYDGRPCVGGNVESPEHIMELLRALGEAGSAVAGSSRVDIPKDN